MLKEILSPQGFLEGTRVVTSWTRPLKVAYIIPTGDADLAVRAIESSCLTWGGADHIFVPYAEGISDDWMKVIDNYDPDFLVDLAGMPEDEREQFNALNRFVHDWLAPKQRLLTPGALIHLAAASFLDALRPEGYRVIIPNVSQSHPLRLPILARYGSLNEAGIEEALREQGIVSITRLSDVVLTATVEFEGVEPHTLLKPPMSLENLRPGGGITHTWYLPQFTLVRVLRGPPAQPLLPPSTPEYEEENRKHASMLLVTGGDACVSDLCLYWTLRANRPHWTDPFPLWVPLSQFQSSGGREVLDIALARAKMQRRGIPGGRDVLYVLSTSATRDEIEAAIDHPFPIEVVTEGFAGFIPPGFERGSREDYEVIFQRGRGRLRRSGEAKIYQFAEFDRVGQEIEVGGIQLPQIASLRHAVFGVPWRITQRGFHHWFYPRHVRQIIPLQLPSTWHVLESLFNEAGYKCTPSDKGRLAVGMLELLGSMGHVAILASSKLFGLLNKMAEAEGRQSFRKLLDELRLKIGRQGIEEITRLALESMPPSEHLRDTLGYSNFVETLRENAGLVLEWLLQRRIVFRGAELRCPVCGLRRWYIIDRVGSEFLCEGCQRVSSTPLKLASTDWRYRLNELYARAFDQGVLPHILLAYQRAYMNLSSEDALLGFYPGVEVSDDSGEVAREIDYVEVRSGRLIIGECKVSGSELREEEADKLVSLANALRCHELVIATIASPPEQQIVESVERALIPDLTLYEGSDLFDRHPLGDQAESPEVYLSRVARRFLE